MQSGRGLIRGLFEALGYSVGAQQHPLDEKFPERGDGPYYDRFFMRMRTKPTFSFAPQLLNFILAYPIVLLCVEDRHQHIKMIEEIL